MPGIPLPYAFLGLILAALASAWGGFHAGAAAIQAEWDAAVNSQNLGVETARRADAEQTVKVVTQYVDRVKVVREKGDTIVKEVPVYVPSDASPLPGGFRVLHDAAVTGAEADPARVADAAAVTAQDAAATVAANYATCRATAEQLSALQAWAKGDQ